MALAKWIEAKRIDLIERNNFPVFISPGESFVDRWHRKRTIDLYGTKREYQIKRSLYERDFSVCYSWKENLVGEGLAWFLFTMRKV